MGGRYAYMSPYVNMYLEEYNYIGATMHVTTMCKVVDVHISYIHAHGKCLHTMGLEVYIHTYIHVHSSLFTQRKFCRGRNKRLSQNYVETEIKL